MTLEKNRNDLELAKSSLKRMVSKVTWYLEKYDLCSQVSEEVEYNAIRNENNCIVSSEQMILEASDKSWSIRKSTKYNDLHTLEFSHQNEKYNIKFDSNGRVVVGSGYKNVRGKLERCEKIEKKKIYKMVYKKFLDQLEIISNNHKILELTTIPIFYNLTKVGLSIPYITHQSHFQSSLLCQTS
jgi:hypothetical protein